MIWFAWRQFRLQALIAVALLLALAIAFLVTGPHLVHYYNTAIVGCRARGDCNAVRDSFLSAYPFLQNLLTESWLLAVLIGVFWGAPIVAREFDTGTFRLAWTQSASRSQWLRAKLLIGGLASVVTTGLFTLVATWWSSPIDRVRDQPFSLFGTRDIVPIGYALFAFALGVAVGAVLRRTVPSMVVTIAGFAAVKGLFFYIRPHFATAKHAVFAFTPQQKGFQLAGNLNPANWMISTKVENGAGRVFANLAQGFDFQPNANGTTALVGAGVCPNKIPSLGGVNHSGMSKAALQCITSFHLHELISYQPVSRYWSFQWYELASYVALSLILSTFSVWWIRRR